MSQSVDQQLDLLRRIIADLEQRLARDEAWQALLEFDAKHGGQLCARSTEHVFARQRIEQRLSQNGDYRVRQRLLEACTILSATVASENTPTAPQVETTSVDARGQAHQPSAVPMSPDLPSQELCRIRGISRAMADRLNALGIRRYAQIAAWNRDDCDHVSNVLQLGRTISRQNWIEQAALLSAKSENEGGAKPAPKAAVLSDTIATDFKKTDTDEVRVSSSPCAMPPIVPRPAVQPTSTAFGETELMQSSQALLERAAASIYRSVSETPDARSALAPVNTPETIPSSAPPLAFTARSCKLPERATVQRLINSLHLPGGAKTFDLPPPQNALRLQDEVSGNADAAHDRRRQLQAAPQIDAHPKWTAHEQFPKDVIKRPQQDAPVTKTPPVTVEATLYDRISDNTSTSPAQAFGNALRRRPPNQNLSNDPPPLLAKSAPPPVPPRARPVTEPAHEPVSDNGSPPPASDRTSMPFPTATQPQALADVEIRPTPLVESTPPVERDLNPPCVNGLKKGPDEARPPPSPAARPLDRARNGFGDGGLWRQHPAVRPDTLNDDERIKDRLLGQNEEATVEIVRRHAVPHGLPGQTGTQPPSQSAKSSPDQGKKLALQLTKRFFHAMTRRSS